MSSSFSFKGSYRFDSAATIRAVLDELREMLDDETEVPDPFESREIVIDRTEVRFEVAGAMPAVWFDHYDTIANAFAQRAQTGEVTVTCEDLVEIYKAGRVE